MARDLLLCVSFCHSTFPSHIGDRWTGPTSVHVTMVSPKAHDMRPLSSSCVTELRKLWGPPLTTAICGLQCIRPLLHGIIFPSINLPSPLTSGYCHSLQSVSFVRAWFYKLGNFPSFLQQLCKLGNF